jgi:hypothetical protein
MTPLLPCGCHVVNIPIPGQPVWSVHRHGWRPTRDDRIGVAPRGDTSAGFAAGPVTTAAVQRGPGPRSHGRKRVWHLTFSPPAPRRLPSQPCRTGQRPCRRTFPARGMLSARPSRLQMGLYQPRADRRNNPAAPGGSERSSRKAPRDPGREAYLGGTPQRHGSGATPQTGLHQPPADRRSNPAAPGGSERSRCKAERDPGAEAYWSGTPQDRGSAPTPQMGLYQPPAEESR